MRVLAVDPGKKTGVVWAEVSVEREITPISWNEVGQKKFVLETTTILEKLDVVICESWKPRGGPLSHQPEALELIGWLRGECWVRNLLFVNTQDPAFAHSVRDGAVKAFPLIGRGGKGHAKMALSHLWGWVQTVTANDLRVQEQNSQNRKAK